MVGVAVVRPISPYLENDVKSEYTIKQVLRFSSDGGGALPCGSDNYLSYKQLTHKSCKSSLKNLSKFLLWQVFRLKRASLWKDFA